MEKEMPEENSDFSEIGTRYLCDTGAVLNRLSYEAASVRSRSILLGPSMPLKVEQQLL